MTQLSVNVNKIATLRNARGGDNPSVVGMSRDILAFGSFGITVHPRPDERHIKKADVFDLKELIAQEKRFKPETEFNIEGYPSSDFIELIQRSAPDQCTLVPDPPDVITSNAGWKFNEEQRPVVNPAVQRLRELGVRSSVFVDPYDVNEEFLTRLKECGPDRVELYTEMYAKNFGNPQQDEVTEVYRSAAEKITSLGIELNAGHDLDQKNLKHLINSIPEIKEVSIGHALVSEALYDGMEKTVKAYLDLLK